MSHAREQIRDAVLQAVTGLATTGARAFASRVHPMNDNEMPCILVFTREEAAERLTQSKPRRQMRRLTVMVEGYAKLKTSYDDKLDTIATEVEKAIYNNTSLQSLVRDIFLINTAITLTGDAEKPVAVISMSFSAEYSTLENNPEIFA